MGSYPEGKGFSWWLKFGIMVTVIGVVKVYSGIAEYIHPTKKG